MTKRDEMFSRGGRLQRAFQPRELPAQGGSVFRTSDGTGYFRDGATGTVRRVHEKLNKKQRRARRAAMIAAMAKSKMSTSEDVQ